MKIITSLVLASKRSSMTRWASLGRSHVVSSHLLTFVLAFQISVQEGLATFRRRWRAIEEQQSRDNRAVEALMATKRVSLWMLGLYSSLVR